MNFTIQQALDPDFRALVWKVLKFWIDYDVDNLFRIKSGIRRFWVPFDYETNTTKFTAWTEQGGNALSEESLEQAHSWLKELLGYVATHRFQNTIW